MNDSEQLLIKFVEAAEHPDAIAILLETYVAANGFLSNEAGDIVKALLAEKQKALH